MFGRATIRLGIGPHSSCLLLTAELVVMATVRTPTSTVRQIDVVVCTEMYAVRRVRCAATVCVWSLAHLLFHTHTDAEHITAHT